VNTTGGINLRVDGLYLTQATQRYDGSVPLVAGRDAFLRVFGVANRSFHGRATVRVLLYHGTVPVASYSLQSKTDSVVTTIDEGNLRGSWNMMVPGRLVVPGLRVLARIDAGDGIAESSVDDNVFPAGGIPGLVQVRSVPPLRVRFVPVVHQASGLTGAVSGATVPKFLADVKVLLPVGEVQAQVRPAFTSYAPPLLPDNSNGGWGILLNELLALKQVDGDARYYYGVVKTSQSSGIAGIGAVGGTARVAIGTDRLPVGSYVMAHEVAHNMGRGHAPCGSVKSSDPAFPYRDGHIGAWGFDPVWQTVKKPSVWIDFTGYCYPYWVSDYSWEAMLAYRRSGPDAAPPLVDGGPGLLLWGRITPAGPVLEPAFSVDQGAAMPAPGPHRIDALDSDGLVLFSVPFAASTVTDLPSGSEELFGFVLPITDDLTRVAELRLVAGGKIAVRRAVAGPAPGPGLMERRVGDTHTITWNSSRYPMVMLRDRATGSVLAFARGGRLRFSGQAPAVDLIFSDGIRARQLRR
jgi:hypothetical protein